MLLTARECDDTSISNAQVCAEPLCSDEAQSSCSASSPTLAGLPHFTPADSLPVSPTSPHTIELHSILSSSCSSPNPSSMCISPQGMLGQMLSQESSSLEAPFFTTAGGGYGKAPGFEREDQDGLGLLPVGSPPMSSISSSMASSLATTPPSPAASSNTRGMNANALPFYPTSDTVESVVESALDDLDLNDFGMAALEKSFDSTTAARSSIMIGGSLLQSSAPVNIPGSLGSSASFHSASLSPPINSSHFMPSSLQQHQRHLSQSDSTFPQGSLGLNGMNSSIWEHFPPGNFSPSSSPAFLTGASPGELTRLRHELDEASRALKQWEESWRQARQACDMWKREAEEANEDAASAGREVAVAVKRREVLEQRAQQLQEELKWLQAGKEPQILHCYEQLQLLPLPTLYNLQTQLRSGLERVEQAVFQLQKVKCLRCQEGSRVMLPCQHTVLCEACSCTEECPVCQPPGTLSLQS
ncbi:UNVERIFIED_CONTAM: hypothetical protein FKN15_049520 [Acipenser sinensis]